MKIVITLFPAILCLAAPALAEPKAAEAAAYVVATPIEQVVLPSNSMVVLQADNSINSGSLHVGSKLALSVVYDVKVGGTVAIPAGTRAEAEISWRTGRGAFGKSAKIEFNLTHLYIGDHAVGLTGHYRVEGHGAPLAALATVVAAGWPGIFVTGHSAKIEPGTQFIAYTGETLAMSVPARPVLQKAVHERAPTQRGVVQVYEGRKAGQDDAILVPM